ncbi:hypothetical protein K505DRAFT_327992 [Melanomma pulvis-pyrius CBS 109.77]|uniref:Uncharacterized protein n=1 Tax=Melanomma pulvis-pyrius CBS 109.77 TaxID=1314802 RepID=A0A6A6X0W6_9PLEO|nr:hypothetical protein K505DRAFT_327992 [Melanomma pulvis-pyrius CBS 109.77]
MSSCWLNRGRKCPRTHAELKFPPPKICHMHRKPLMQTSASLPMLPSRDRRPKSDDADTEIAVRTGLLIPLHSHSHLNIPPQFQRASKQQTETTDNLPQCRHTDPQKRLQTHGINTPTKLVNACPFRAPHSGNAEATLRQLDSHRTNVIKALPVY